jgi:hypothetical protein
MVASSAHTRSQVRGRAGRPCLPHGISSENPSSVASWFCEGTGAVRGGTRAEGITVVTLPRRRSRCQRCVIAFMFSRCRETADGGEQPGTHRAGSKRNTASAPPPHRPAHANASGSCPELAAKVDGGVIRPQDPRRPGPPPLPQLENKKNFDQQNMAQRFVLLN